MLGGLVVGIGGLIEPQALGVGYDNIASMLRGSMLPASALLLLIVKAIIWAVALGSGTSGGVLAPLLIMGGGMGAALAARAARRQSGLLGAAGDGATMGGTMRSPLTATFFAAEAHRQHTCPAATAGRVRDRSSGHRAADATLHPDREGRPSRSSPVARIPCRSVYPDPCARRHDDSGADTAWRHDAAPDGRLPQRPPHVASKLSCGRMRRSRARASSIRRPSCVGAAAVSIVAPHCANSSPAAGRLWRTRTSTSMA